MGYLNIAGNAMYFESIPNNNLEEQGPGKMKTRGPGSSRRLAPPSPALLPDGAPRGLARDAEILFTSPQAPCSSLSPH